MEAVQQEIHSLKNKLEDIQSKNKLLKTEYQKVKQQNLRFKKLLKEINQKVSTYIIED